MNAGDSLPAQEPLLTVLAQDIKITIYLNPSSEDLRCLNCTKPIEKGMPIVREKIGSPPRVFKFHQHLSCFSAIGDVKRSFHIGKSKKAIHTKIQNFLDKNPDLLVIEKLSGIRQ